MGILECFHVLLATGNQPALVQDNICGAIARMIMAAPQALPLDQVVYEFLYAFPKKRIMFKDISIKCMFKVNNRNTNLLSRVAQKPCTETY